MSGKGEGEGEEREGDQGLGAWPWNRSPPKGGFGGAATGRRRPCAVMRGGGVALGL